MTKAISTGERGVLSERIDVHNYSVDPPERVCSFWWVEGLGVACDQKWMLDFLAKQGVATPPNGELVYPHDGRRFFDALPAHYSGSYMRSTPPEKAPTPKRLAVAKSPAT